MPPELKYAKTADGVHVAYTVVGDGPPLVIAPTLTQCVEWAFEDPACSRFIDRLASFSRVIVFDKRGTGRSDPLVGAPTLEERSEDILAVMDAALADRAVLLGLSEGGCMSAMFAATRPERTAGLVLWGTLARTVGRPGDLDDPFLLTEEMIQHLPDFNESEWGSGIDMWNPSVMNDPAHQRSHVRRMQLGASPAMAAEIGRLAMQTDIRPILQAINVPTLVLHRTNDLIPFAHGRFIAERIPGARLVELPGKDHYPWIADMESVIAEVQAFVTGVRPSTSYDRVLAAVMFTDLVESTDRAVRSGDRAWRDILVQHTSFVREHVQRARGRFIRSMGDGVLATFDGPSRAVHCAHAIVTGMPDLGLEARAGVHTGEIELVSDDDIGGIAVHIAERVMSKADAGQVFTTSTVKELSVGAGIVFEDQGEHDLKGVPDKWRLYRAKAAL